MTNESPLRVEAASVVALRFFDLGGAVDLDAVEAAGAALDATRPQFPGAGAAGFRYAVPPVELSLDEVQIPIEGSTVYADATARVFDFGVAAVALRVLVGGLDWDRFDERVDQIEQAVRSDANGGRIWAEATGRLAPVLGRGASGGRMDPAADHLFVILRRFDRALSADQLFEEVDVPSLVANDRQPLSSVARAEVLRSAYSYHPDDLVVVGAHRSLVLEAAPGTGVPDAIEAALAQHVIHHEMRRRLLSEYDTVYAGITPALVGPTGASVRPLPRRHGALARAAAMRAGDVLRRAEALIVAPGAGHLSSVYAAARDRLRSGEAEASAQRRLAALRAGYGDRPSTSGAGLVVIAVILALIVVALVVLAS